MEFAFERNEYRNRCPVQIMREISERVTHFKHLGSNIEEEGGTETEITARVGPGYRTWKKYSGVLRNRRTPAKMEVTREANCFFLTMLRQHSQYDSRLGFSFMVLVRVMVRVR